MATYSVSTNLALSPPSFPASTSSSCSYSSKISCYCKSRIIKPICLVCVRNQSLNCRRLKWIKEFQILKVKPCRERLFLAAISRGSMDNAEYGEVDDEKEENPPLSVESEMYSKPRRIALFVEPSPFSYISGYKNRFQNFIKYLREMGDEAMVVTTHEGVPQEFYGAKLIGSLSFPCPWYQKVPLSLALSPRIISAVAQFKPDIIHASSPGIMVFGALIIAKLLSVPIVLLYHTHVPVYVPISSHLLRKQLIKLKFISLSTECQSELRAVIDPIHFSVTSTN